MKHITVALFVPHKGCPHQCSFCNQRSISGTQSPTTPDDVHEAVKTAMKNPDVKGAEIAFFGGSFTAIERDYMMSLLKTAGRYIDGDVFSGIRISTRPDAIDSEICSILKENHVTAVELGAQSMDDAVLKMNSRGHTSHDVVKAMSLLKKFGFETGLQMMTGLYGSSKKESIDTAKKIISLSPDTVRIYPTVVLEGTHLAELYKNGEYSPQSVDEAVDICSEILPMFYDAGIRVIRVGLHSGGGVDGGFVAGAYHPAFRELCESRIYYNNMLGQVRRFNPPCELEIEVSPSALSQAIGQKKENIIKLGALGYSCKITQSPGLKKYQVLVKEKTYDT